MPNGQNREVYTQQCHAFIEKHYERFVFYARKICQGDEELAREVLHDTCVGLLEGRYTVDINTMSLAYFYKMLRSYANPKRYSITRNATWVYGLNFDDTANPSDQNENISFLLEHFDQLTKTLSKKQKQCLEWWLDGLTNKETMEIRHCTKSAAQDMLTRARKKIKKAAIALLQADSLGATGHLR
jgi:RNA polymerase sigma factor (sigma-70 family)